MTQNTPSPHDTPMLRQAEALPAPLRRRWWPQVAAMRLRLALGAAPSPAASKKTLNRVENTHKSAIMNTMTTRNSAITLDHLKLEAVTHYVIAATKAIDSVGKTVMHKLLYFIDFDYYEKYDKTLMGERYIKKPRGPFSENLESVVQQLVDAGKIEVEQRDYHGKPQEKYISLMEADTSCLSAMERNHIDGVLKELAGKNATQISDYAHGDVPWDAAELGEYLNYKTVFYRDDKYSKREPQNAF